MMMVREKIWNQTQMVHLLLANVRTTVVYIYIYIYILFLSEDKLLFRLFGSGKTKHKYCGLGDGDVNCTTLFTRKSSLYTDLFRRISMNERL